MSSIIDLREGSGLTEDIAPTFSMERLPTMAKLRESPVDYARPIKVICIGAGMSGILCGIRFPQKIPNLDLTIYEKNDEVGGVWHENRCVSVATVGSPC